VRWLLPLALAAGGCLAAIAPDVGPPASCTGAACVDGGVPACSNADSDPAVAVSFAADLLGGVFRRYGCTSCHTDGIGAQQSGLRLASYATLRTGGGRTGATIVIDGQPCQSLLPQKLSNAPPFGRRMPYNGPPYLTTAELKLVHDWIAEGAHDN
jgi:hypothetical protein